MKPIVGIDLGTTNCAMAYSTGEGISPYPIMQLIAPGEVRNEALLPSFLYFPAGRDFPEGATALPWDAQPKSVVGVLARKRGGESLGRQVASAKSWLSYAGVDRQSELLPLNAADGVAKVSPVAASQIYLEHLDAAWRHAGNEGLREAHVVLTVPASFDAVARQLTEQAALQAGLGQVILLEEPQAAFYAWLERHEDWRERIGPGDRVLIVDIGGGTTDFTLVDVKNVGGNLELERVAVGDHILLGGDNMDLALAKHVEAGLLAKGTKLDGQQLLALWQQCRTAKESLLDLDNPTEEQPVTVLGRGSSLIGSTIRAKLTRTEVSELLVEGFFPVVGKDETPAKAKRSALAEIALPYASDARITAHLAHFVAQAGAPPTHVLFNGGVLRSGVLRTRILEVLGQWFGRPVTVLEGEDLMEAVARGAAYYGAVRFGGGKGVRIRGGVARSYYVGIEDAMPAVPGMRVPMKAFTVVPFGMEEGSAHAFPQRRFGLMVGEPVEFRMFSSTERREDGPGELFEVLPEDLTELPGMEITLKATERHKGGLVPVTLESRVTETGVLELYCVAADGERWKLEFNVRERKS